MSINEFNGAGEHNISNDTFLPKIVGTNTKIKRDNLKHI